LEGWEKKGKAKPADGDKSTKKKVTLNCDHVCRQGNFEKKRKDHEEEKEGRPVLKNKSLWGFRGDFGGKKNQGF